MKTDVWGKQIMMSCCSQRWQCSPAVFVCLSDHKQPSAWPICSTGMLVWCVSESQRVSKFSPFTTDLKCLSLHNGYYFFMKWEDENKIAIKIQEKFNETAALQWYTQMLDEYRLGNSGLGKEWARCGAHTCISRHVLTYSCLCVMQWALGQW